MDIKSARRVLQFQFEPAVRARVDELAARANEGQLTERERAEYEAYLKAADFVATLKAQARRLLSMDGDS